MIITNVEYKITSICYTVEYKNRINKNVECFIENMMCFGMLYILCTNRNLYYKIDSLNLDKIHIRNYMSTIEYMKIVHERNMRLSNTYNPKPINIRVLF